VPLAIYSRDFVTGSISLGGNMASDAKGAASNYTLAIVGHGTPAGGPVGVSGLTVSSNKVYQVVPALSVGHRVYIDRSYTHTDIPAVIDGAVYIRTANDDKHATQQEFLSFTVDTNVTVYVAYDSRATSLPDWMSEWVDTGKTTNSTDVVLNLYSMDFPPGRVVLGGNKASGAVGAESNYIVMVVADIVP
jgi:hypothetical protein